MAVDDGIRIDGTTVLNGEYESYLGVRIAGGVIGVVGLTLMAIALPVSHKFCDPPGDPNCEPVDMTLLGTLLGVGAGATIGGAFMFFKRDEAHITSGMEEARARFHRGVAPGPTLSIGRRWTF